ncbi:hypothetical protein HHK36_025135 [Tetracentron sinense]|uniref:CCHC-type domain-containing protein n=1 Tax=Tetracentron sinense TaxID=13715 RepID=A0A834YQB5_TETSI|nr:hypothetical protein HHK36_025135 [Tetracentron sinense]
MFYSHLLLSRKGPLGTVWVAAYCHKRLKKDQVAETDIPSSVDTIMLDEVPVFTYRVLGYLLLGIARIYSKKVDYLFHDCNEVLIKINDFMVCKKIKSLKEAMCAPYLSITLPDTFELDAFDLEVLEDLGGGNVTPHEKIVLEEARENEEKEHYSLNKHHIEEVTTHHETFSSGYAPVEDTFSLSPHMMDIDLMVSSSHNLSGLEASMEKLRDSQFNQEECMDPKMFCRAEEPLDHGTQIGEVDSDAEQIKVQEILSVIQKHHVLTECHPVAVAPNGTPNESKFPHVSGYHPVASLTYFNNSYFDAGATTPEFMVIPTPAKKEQARISIKRKCFFDENIVLPNMVVRENIHNSSSLVRKRRKAPQTSLGAWKAHIISNFPQGFLEPLIPCICVEFKSLFPKKNLKTPEPVEAAESPSKSDESGFQTVCRSSKQKTISWGKSVDHSTSMRSLEPPTISESDKTGPPTSVESVGKEHSPNETEDVGLNLMDEEISPDGGDNQKMHEWSVRTRVVARYLHKCFLNQKERTLEEVVSLMHALEGRTRKESGRLFYEILVLKTGGFIDVKQDSPYDDIFVLKTPQMEAILYQILVKRSFSTPRRIEIRYERLPSFCFNCGIMGHEARYCLAKPLVLTEGLDPPYGPWLRADYFRFHHNPSKGCGRDSSFRLRSSPIEDISGSFSSRRQRYEATLARVHCAEPPTLTAVSGFLPQVSPPTNPVFPSGGDLIGGSQHLSFLQVRRKETSNQFGTTHLGLCPSLDSSLYPNSGKDMRKSPNSEILALGLVSSSPLGLMQDTTDLDSGPMDSHCYVPTGSDNDPTADNPFKGLR